MWSAGASEKRTAIWLKADDRHVCDLLSVFAARSSICRYTRPSRLLVLRPLCPLRPLHRLKFDGDIPLDAMTTGLSPTRKDTDAAYCGSPRQPAGTVRDHAACTRGHLGRNRGRGNGLFKQENIEKPTEQGIRADILGEHTSFCGKFALNTAQKYPKLLHAGHYIISLPHRSALLPTTNN